MAKINGVEIKSVKSFVGHEGVCYQGNVFKDGKKLGFWSQDSWGGPDEFDFDESILDDVCKDYKAGFPDDYKYKEFCDSKDIFMNAVLELKLLEKDCKREFKKGARSVFMVSDGFHYSWLGLLDDIPASEVERRYPKQVDNMRSQMFKNGHNECILTPTSFDIRVDMKNPAPDILKSAY